MIIPNLYLGSAEAARNEAWLKKVGIRRVLNVASEVPNHFEGSEITYLKIATDDNPDQALLNLFDEATAFVARGLALGEPVLIHCRHGKSRSLSFLVAYLIKHQSMGMDTVENHAKKMGIRSPKKMNNVGFYAHLVAWAQQCGQVSSARRRITFD